MNLGLFIGLQATGKSTFYKERFFHTHMRINLDMLRTRHRERLLFDACIEGRAMMVVDNTNLTRELRERYIAPARRAGFFVSGYFFQSRLADALARNATRQEEQRVPELALRGASRRLELPDRSEGFDQLTFVRISDDRCFIEEEWKDEV